MIKHTKAMHEQYRTYHQDTRNDVNLSALILNDTSLNLHPDLQQIPFHHDPFHVHGPFQIRGHCHRHRVAVPMHHPYLL
ncbi:hypothetical protein OIU84_008570, partial [Salix udensis]